MLIFWIWLAQLSGVTISQKLSLLEQFYDPEGIYRADTAALSAVGDITPKALESLCQKDLTKANEILESCVRQQISIVTYGDREYPPRLKNIYNPPLVLYYKGTLPRWEDRPVIAMVGTRKASTYGMQIAEKMGNQIAGCGAWVVSGGADGIDTWSLLGAMQTGNPVIAVLGCGADVVYPAKNRRLFADIQNNGCLITEFCPGTPANSWNFPMRNRIVSGLSTGVVVIEAPERSGALNTAKHAMEQGRDIYVVPGNVNNPNCAGSNLLLRKQAVAVFEGWDVVQEYSTLYPGVLTHYAGEKLQVAQTKTYPQVKPKDNDKKVVDNPLKCQYSVEDKPQKDLTEEEKAVLACLTAEPVAVDTVIDAAQLPAGKVLSVLTMLAMKGIVSNYPGKRVSLKS